MASPKAILLDLDGTIVNFSSAIETAWESIAEGAASQLQGLDIKTLSSTLIQTGNWWWSDPERERRGRHDVDDATFEVANLSLEKLGLVQPALAQQMAEQHREAVEASWHLYPGVVEALEGLKKRGTKLGLITNGGAEHQRAKIDRFGLTRHFDYILIEGEFGVGKPDARVYHAAMSALGSVPSDTWMVGDNLVSDVSAAQQLGIFGVWYNSDQAGLPDGSSVIPDRIIQSLTELP